MEQSLQGSTDIGFIDGRVVVLVRDWGMRQRRSIVSNSALGYKCTKTDIWGVLQILPFLKQNKRQYSGLGSCDRSYNIRDLFIHK